MQERGTTVSVPGAELSVVELGAGRPLLVVHGGPGESHAPLRPFLDALASSERRVVYYDQRHAPVSAREHAADVARLCAHLGPEPIDLLGFSWGALLALAHARAHPATVRRLLLVSPPSPSEDRELGARLAAAADRAEVRAVLWELEGERARFAARVAPVLRDPRHVHRIAPCDVDQPTRDAALASVGELELGGGALALPCLVLAGAEDLIAAPHAAGLAERLGARLALVEACGHAPFAEAPEAFASIARAFLDAAPGQPREGRVLP